MIRPPSYLIGQGRRQELMDGVFCFHFPSLLPFPSIPLFCPSLCLPNPFPSLLLSSPSPPLSLSFPSPPLRSRAPLNQLGVLGERCKLPQWPKTNLVHSRAVRKPLVAIILSIKWTEKLD